MKKVIKVSLLFFLSLLSDLLIAETTPLDHTCSMKVIDDQIDPQGSPISVIAGIDKSSPIIPKTRRKKTSSTHESSVLCRPLTHVYGNWGAEKSAFRRVQTAEFHSDDIIAPEDREEFIIDEVISDMPMLVCSFCEHIFYQKKECDRYKSLWSHLYAKHMMDAFRNFSYICFHEDCKELHVDEKTFNSPDNVKKHMKEEHGVVFSDNKKKGVKARRKGARRKLKY